jgi:hypothetical protein
MTGKIVSSYSRSIEPARDGKLIEMHSPIALPIVEHFRATASDAEIEQAEVLAASLIKEQPNLTLPSDFHDLIPTEHVDGPTLHLDDLAAIPFLDAGQDARFYQERARLRACDGDVVVTAEPVAEGYETYCRDYLDLGQVEWLSPAPTKNPLRVAEACWEDEIVRNRLIDKLRAGELIALHPHMGTLSVWELGALLSEASGRPLKVISPPPRLSHWVNDKIAFTDLVTRLFGDHWVPRTTSAYNFSLLAKRIATFAETSPRIGIKIPNSAGGDGTLVVDGAQFQSKRLTAIRSKLKDVLRALNWNGDSELLIDSWETDILLSPSAQLWIPPEKEGGPIVEGLFTQDVEGLTGVFIGCRPANLPEHLTQEIVNRCWLIALVFQRLGYVGRCSFDLVLVGMTLEDCRIEFIECNGRWGGASTPMTLMNRLFGDWRTHPYISQVCQLAGLDRMSFLHLLELLRDGLLDHRSGKGNLIITTPGRMKVRSAVDIISVGASVEQAKAAIDNELIRPLREELGVRE